MRASPATLSWNDGHIWCSEIQWWVLRPHNWEERDHAFSEGLITESEVYFHSEIHIYALGKTVLQQNSVLCRPSLWHSE